MIDLYIYSGLFAGIELVFAFQHPETAEYYGNTLRTSSSHGETIRIPMDIVTDWMMKWKCPDFAYAEYVMSCSYACDYLLRHKCIVFHGCSFLWNGCAYLFSAPSGTGKTTQMRLWKKLFPEEVEILNGDKPILEIKREVGVIVHPSPWKGKEGYGRDDIIAPLGGIIFLRQAPENTICTLSPAKAARSLFGRSYSTFRSEKEIRNNALIIEKIVNAVPVWLLCNRGDEDSAKLTHETLIKEGL